MTSRWSVIRSLRWSRVAGLAARRLRATGITHDTLQVVTSRVMRRDRTYSSAVALRNWFQEHNLPVRSLNVMTEDVHARRTRLLFQKALGEDVTVGIISVPNPDYDSKRWWRYSEGVREILGDYLYARFLFYPAKPES